MTPRPAKGRSGASRRAHRHGVDAGGRAFEEVVLQEIERSIEAKRLLARTQTRQIASFATATIGSLKRGGKLVLFGNGGSAADAQHIAAEFVGRYELERRPMPAIALTTNTSSLTAISNDYGYESVFERQVRALCRPVDVVAGISTSGTSRNVILGVKAARSIGAYTVGMTGETGGGLARCVDLAIRVPASSTSRVQECHIMIGHIVSRIVESQTA